jgi:hypothetical protein
MINNDKTKTLEDELVELLRLFYKILDQLYDIDPKRTIDLYKVLLESMQNRSKLFSENQPKTSSNGKE